MDPVNEARTLAVEDVARTALHGLEISMEHRDAERVLRASDVRRALELAYDRGHAAAKAVL